jgi:hypothetical protein
MTKQNADTTESTAIATTPKNTAIERPSFIPQSAAGTEHITKDDIQVPRLALAQGLTPQVQADKEGFKTGVLFNSVTEELLGTGPIDFYIVRADRPRFIEFFPRETGGGVKDMNVPANDPRTQFTKGENGQTVKPLATKFYDFLIVLADRLSTDPLNALIALSFKSSGLKAAKTLNNLVKFRNAPLFAGKYRLTTAKETNAKGTYAIYKIENAGFVQDKETYDVLEGMFSVLADKQVTIDREGADDPDEFDPAKFGGDNA